MEDRVQAQLLVGLLRARSIEEVVAVAERSPVVLTPEFGQLIGGMISLAVSEGDAEFAGRLEQVAQILSAMRGVSPGRADTAFWAQSPAQRYAAYRTLRALESPPFFEVAESPFGQH